MPDTPTLYALEAGLGVPAPSTGLYRDAGRTHHVMTVFRPISEGEVITDSFGKPFVVTWAQPEASKYITPAEAARCHERVAAGLKVAA